jgi:RNA polymerase sigma-70 factor, ECF subfamily
VVEGLRQLDPERLGDHVDRLYRAAWGLCGSREDAEDLVQETYARVLAKPRMLSSEDDLGYLLRGLRNTFFSKHRTATRRPVQAAMPESYDPPDPSSSRSPQAMAETREVFAAIADLPDDYRDVIVAVDLAGLSYAEAGEVVGAGEQTVASRLFRARHRVAASVGGPA